MIKDTLYLLSESFIGYENWVSLLLLFLFCLIIQYPIKKCLLLFLDDGIRPLLSYLYFNNIEEKSEAHGKNKGNVSESIKLKRMIKQIHKVDAKYQQINRDRKKGNWVFDTAIEITYLIFLTIFVGGLILCFIDNISTYSISDYALKQLLIIIIIVVCNFVMNYSIKQKHSVGGINEMLKVYNWSEEDFSIIIDYAILAASLMMLSINPMFTLYLFFFFVFRYLSFSFSIKRKNIFTYLKIFNKRYLSNGLLIHFSILYMAPCILSIIFYVDKTIYSYSESNVYKWFYYRRVFNDSGLSYTYFLHFMIVTIFLLLVLFCMIQKNKGNKKSYNSSVDSFHKEAKK